MTPALRGVADDGSAVVAGADAIAGTQYLVRVTGIPDFRAAPHDFDFAFEFDQLDRSGVRRIFILGLAQGTAAQENQEKSPDSSQSKNGHGGLG